MIDCDMCLQTFSTGVLVLVLALKGQTRYTVRLTSEFNSWNKCLFSRWTVQERNCCGWTELPSSHPRWGRASRTAGKRKMSLCLFPSCENVSTRVCLHSVTQMWTVPRQTTPSPRDSLERCDSTLCWFYLRFSTRGAATDQWASPAKKFFCGWSKGQCSTLLTY